MHIIYYKAWTIAATWIFLRQLVASVADIPLIWRKKESQGEHRFFFFWKGFRF